MTDWKAVIDGNFMLPDGLGQREAVDELLTLLRDPDPVIRDETAYTVLAGLIPSLDESICHELGDQLAGWFTDPRLHVRSFAALTLAPIVDRGLFDPSWLTQFERWYLSETDLRGYDEELGWLHAVAHGADLLGAFAQRQQVAPAQILAIAAERILQPTEYVFAEMEDARVAHAIALTLNRRDLPSAEWAAWLETIRTDLVADESVHVLPHVGNTTRVLQALYMFADRGVRRDWDSTEVLSVRDSGPLKAKIAEVLQSVIPYAA
jgi:hypothetical protein